MHVVLVWCLDTLRCVFCGSRIFDGGTHVASTAVALPLRSCSQYWWHLCV